MNRPARLLKLRVAGFRSLADVTIEPGPVTVLIGPNGAGKSNVLWALELVRLLAHDALQLFVGERGGASFLLHYGPKVTPHIDLQLEFENTDGTGHNAYEARLGYASDESLVFASERAGFWRSATRAWTWTDLGQGHRESRLAVAAPTDPTARTVLWLLRHLNFYHFHDTSFRSPLRTRSFEQTSGRYLRSDGSNLPVFLLGLKQSTQPSAQAAWRRIEGTLQRLAPFVRSIDPVEDRRGIVHLEWQNERGQAFGPAHLSDGTLRALALIAALGQPEEGMPFLSCIDEPELGLHPAAIEMLCGLISSVGARRQVIVSTQSPALLDHFGPADLIVAERRDGATALRRLDPAALSVWLEEYSLSQLFDKNVLGGRP